MSPPRPLVVGILNCTPDSFHDGGRFEGLEDQVEQAHKMLSEGADWIDIGGESTRPGAAPVPVEQELARVLPIIAELGDQVPISIDSTKPEVVRAALSSGARIINDIHGLSDPDMVALSADAEACVVMHSRGTPANMARMTDYGDLLTEVRDWLLERANRSRSATTWLDPGIGFAKTADQSLALLQGLETLVQTGFPVYIGASRKSFIGKTLDLEGIESRLAGSLAAACLAYERGAMAVRVHDVACTRQALDLLHAARGAPVPTPLLNTI
jgi:dihydropteroate synthase